jgi:hypothetical protein
VPPAWERCKRCDADLADTAPRELVGAGATTTTTSTTSSTFGAARFGGAPPTLQPTPARPKSAAFTAFEPSAPVNVRDTYQRVPTAGESWSSVRPAAMPRKLPIVGLLVLVAIVGSSWFAWKQATARHIPAELKPFVHDGTGVDYTTSTGRFTVTLPNPPQEMTQEFVVSGASMNVAAAFSILDEHAIGVAWFDVPSNLIANTDINANLRQLAEGYATTDGDVLKELDFLTSQGFNAVDASFEREGTSGKVRVILAGTRVYVLVAGGTSGGAIGFEQLTQSFDIT